MTNLTWVRSTRHNYSRKNARLTARITGVVERYDDIVSDKGSKDLRYELLVTGALQANHVSDDTCDTLRNLFAYRCPTPRHLSSQLRPFSASPTKSKRWQTWCRPHSRNPVQASPDLDILSSDSADSLREQVRQVHQRLDEVQKEVLKSKGEVGKSSKGGSPFTPEIQDKPLSANFRLPALKLYDDSCSNGSNTTRPMR
ncbi:hypothetical protein B296_00031457 [Ensete ventricosum]|uniref:Uncharacterized protein n=1 Tax=Ensete ventricosum TaxID=4639 RepID=A0A427AG84_ENSVE|nr:hypothetical protein B296_00031457 [Ensete ventricosum]